MATVVRPLTLLIISGCISLYAEAEAGVLDEEAPADAAKITEGDEAQLCQYPTALAALSSGRVGCSATLVAPDVALLAAHCLFGAFGQPSEFAFGEDGRKPTRKVPVKSCDSHPNFFGAGDRSYFDIAYCILREEVDDVPITPIAMGCELDDLQEGSSVTIVGFGATSARFDLESKQTVVEGDDLKHYTEQKVVQVREEDGYLDLEGDGNNSACYGDSGGPAFLRLPSGEVRTLGAASYLIEPDENDDDFDPDRICGRGISYTLAYPFLDWLEESSGRDLSPCFTSSGEWEPSERCRSFAIDPGLGQGEWEDGCINGGVSDWVESCGPAFSDEDDNESGESDESGWGTGDTGSDENGENTSNTENATSQDEGEDDSSASGAEAGSRKDENSSSNPQEGPSETSGGCSLSAPKNNLNLLLGFSVFFCLIRLKRGWRFGVL